LGLVALRVDGPGASSAACLERDGKIGELGERVVVERAEQRRLESGDVIVQGIDHQPDRRIALELSGAPVEHQPGALLGAAAKLCQQPRLADPRLASQVDKPRLAGPDAVESVVKLGDLAPRDRPACPIAVVVSSPCFLPESRLLPVLRGLKGDWPCHGIPPWQGFPLVPRRCP
jgi:hypothetical protein